MRRAIIADIHANLEGLEAVLADAQSQGVDEYACLGDIVGYGADPLKCLQRVQQLDCPVVMGNHDEDAIRTTSLERMSPLAAAAMEWTRNQLGEQEKQWLGALKKIARIKTVTLVHASLDSPESWPYVSNRWDAIASMAYQLTPLCFHGHTHVPAIYSKHAQVEKIEEQQVRLEKGTQYFVNVGSVGQPRDGDWRASYAIFDEQDNSVEIRRVEYDISGTQLKILAAGLPELLATRLQVGR